MNATETATCKAPECRADLYNGVSRHGYCQGCSEPVEAFRPNPEMDEWFVVSDLGRIDGDQCGNCGGIFYEASLDAVGNLIVTCVDGSYADGPHEGCGDVKGVRSLPSYKVIF